MAQLCKQAPGEFHPVIDRNRCEGKAECVAVCPKSVFSLGILPRSERSALSLRGRIKGFVHGWRQAMTPNAAACEACGRCVEACPEQAIKLASSLQPGATT